jgi:mevalonate pyrophosphate decarboxylase
MTERLQYNVEDVLHMFPSMEGAMFRKLIRLMISPFALMFATVATASETVTYTYDAKGRLVKVVHVGTVNNNLIANYTFDAADNRKSLVVTST